MRDTSDMMEDALSEDTMMDCGGDGGGLEDFVDLATDITDNSSTIRDAAERLLTLLGVDDGDNDDLVSSSEDEGVEVDIDELEDDDEETGNTKLLHHLAASLAQELKYSTSTRSVASTSGRTAHRSPTRSVEMLQDTSYLERGCLQDQAEPKVVAPVHHQVDFFARSEQLLDERSTVGRTKFLSFDGFCQDRQEPLHSRSFEPKDTASHAFSGYMCLDQRLRTQDQDATQPGKYFAHQQEQDTDSWTAGWDACANEALRYLVEDEGLPLHHPTVVAMKNHLDLQRERAFAQHTGYTEAKSQDMNLALD